MGDFDRIFESNYSAVDLFTDRRSESAVFADSLMRHLERMADGAASLAQPRQNVLTFYGMGGIGKTELSHRLERWLAGELIDLRDWDAPPRLDQEVVTVRFDFHGSSVVNASDIVLRLRAAVASRFRIFPAFDLGLAVWWAAAHPGTGLPEIRSATGFDVKGQITDTLNDILSEAGARFGLGPLTVRMADQIVRAVVSHHRHRKTLGECPPLETVVEEARHDPSPYVAATLAGLLTWDMERLHIAETPVLVAFADAAEYIQGGNRVQERLLNRIIHLTPGVLWVVTTRDRLEWDSSQLSAVLAAAGPRAWPGLRLAETTEPHQHLVGDLSDTDVVAYLRSASGMAGNPVLGAEVIERIRSGAHGLPLYLDLSLAIARAAPDRRLEPAQFGGSLPELVIRVFADLSPEERDFARTASLVPRFDPQLIAEATARDLGGAQSFCRRTLAVADSHAMFPFRLHDAIRAAVNADSADALSAWALQDRTKRAASLVEALHARHNGIRGDPEQRLYVLELVAHLCTAHDLRPSWLLSALTDLPGLTQTAARLPPPDESTWIGQVSRFFEAWRGRSTRERINYLSSLLQTPLPADVDQAARRWLGYSSSTVADYDKALAVFTYLLSQEPGSDRYRYQVARNLHSLGLYNEIKSHLEQFPIKDHSMEVRFQSDLAYDRGEIEEAMDGAAYRAAQMRASGNHRVALENQVVSLWRAALARRASIRDCDAVIADADRHGVRLTMRSALAAKAVCLLGDDAAIAAIFAEMAAIIDSSSGWQSWRESSVGLLHALHRHDRERIAQIHSEWEAAAPKWTPNQQIVDRIFIYSGYSPKYQRMDMGDPAEGATIDQRWHAIIGSLVNPGRQS
jgi:hypothetical protein